MNRSPFDQLVNVLIAIDKTRIIPKSIHDSGPNSGL